MTNIRFHPEESHGIHVKEISTLAPINFNALRSGKPFQNSLNKLL
jgi:hypothetical protein